MTKNKQDWQNLDLDMIFEPDGSLLDILVLNTTLDDWQNLLNYLHRISRYYTIKYFIDGKNQKELTRNASELFDEEEQTSRLIQVTAKNLIINNHCFIKSEIEFDIDPKEVNSKEHIQLVFDFIKKLGDNLGKPVRLTPENSKDIILYTYETKLRP